MRRLLTYWILLPLATAGLVLHGHSTAYADTLCQQTDPATGQCLVWIEVPGDPNDPGDPGNPRDDDSQNTGAGGSCYWDGTDQGITKPPPGPVPCQAKDGYWSNNYHCYIMLVDPQPAAGDPSWQGHDSNDGAVYACYQPQTDLLIYIWSQDRPPNSAAGPTPGDVAQIAISQMNLRAIDIGIAPEPGDDSIGLVGMPVWMWAANPDSHTYGPITAAASAGGVTVTAAARVEKITWEMGDGNEVVCTSAGPPYMPSYGRRESPDCGYVYETSSSNEPGGRFSVTARSEWVVTWAGAGQTGTIRLNGLQRSVQVAVGEAQVLVK